MIGRAKDVSVQVADFGLSRQAGCDSVDTDTYGTVTHMPPELLMEGKLTKSADVYAFGVLLWELYTGEIMLSSDLGCQALKFQTCAVVVDAHMCNITMTATCANDIYLR